jgi:hypothetical protein
MAQERYSRLFRADLAKMHYSWRLKGTDEGVGSIWPSDLG